MKRIMKNILITGAGGFIGSHIAEFYSKNEEIEEIIDYAKRIIKAISPHLILNLGDILPSNGDIHKMIELGKWVDEYNAGKHKF